jgi:hypothetical protein
MAEGRIAIRSPQSQRRCGMVEGWKGAPVERDVDAVKSRTLLLIVARFCGQYYNVPPGRYAGCDRRGSGTIIKGTAGPTDSG